MVARISENENRVALGDLVREETAPPGGRRSLPRNAALDIYAFLVGCAAIGMVLLSGYLWGLRDFGFGVLIDPLAALALVGSVITLLVVMLVRRPKSAGEIPRRLLLPLVLAGLLVSISLACVRNRWDLECFYIGLHRRVTSRIDLAELQAAADELMARQRKTGQRLRWVGSQIDSSPEIPEPIRRLEPKYVWVYPGEPLNVAILWGGGFGHYGVMVYEEDPERSDKRSRFFRHWYSRVYGYQGI